MVHLVDHSWSDQNGLVSLAGQWWLTQASSDVSDLSRQSVSSVNKKTNDLLNVPGVGRGGVCLQRVIFRTASCVASGTILTSDLTN